MNWKGFHGTLQKLMEWYGCCQIQEPVIWCWASCTISETKKSCGGTGKLPLTLHGARKLKHSTEAHKMVVYITHEIIINKINNLYHHLSAPLSCLDQYCLEVENEATIRITCSMFGCVFFFSRGEVYVFVWFELSDTQPCTHTPLADSILHAALITEENKNRKNNIKIRFCTDTQKSTWEPDLWNKSFGRRVIKLTTNQIFL